MKNKQNKSEQTIPDWLLPQLWEETKELFERLAIPAQLLTNDFKHGLNYLYEMTFLKGYYRGYHRGYKIGEKEGYSRGLADGSASAKPIGL
jgi:hypothetical protein